MEQDEDEKLLVKVIQEKRRANVKQDERNTVQQCKQMTKNDGDSESIDINELETREAHAICVGLLKDEDVKRIGDFEVTQRGLDG